MIWVRKIQDENGMYVSEDGTRWQVDWCNRIYCPCGLSEAEHGYEAFESMEEALAAWGLTAWVDPEAEITNDDLLITNDENE